MPDPINVQQMMEQLHDQKIINIDAPIRSLLQPDAIGIVDPVNPLADNVVAWNEYVLVTKGKPTGISEISQVADALRQVIRQPGIEQGKG